MRDEGKKKGALWNSEVQLKSLNFSTEGVNITAAVPRNAAALTLFHSLQYCTTGSEDKELPV